MKFLVTLLSLVFFATGSIAFAADGLVEVKSPKSVKLHRQAAWDRRLPDC